MKTKIKARATKTASRGPASPAEFQARNILVPLDFSEHSRHALRYAHSMARQLGAKLMLLYVLEPVATPDFAYHPLMMTPKEATATAKNQLEHMCEREGIDPISIAQIVVREGVAYAEITEGAADLKADLIVIATHGNTGLKHVLLGSTAERVVRHAQCPVLVVH